MQDLKIVTHTSYPYIFTRNFPKDLILFSCFNIETEKNGFKEQYKSNFGHEKKN